MSSINSLFDKMLTIRAFEMKLLNLFSEGKIRGTTHTCIGQEANCVGVISCLRKGDFIFSNHRNHGHYLSLTGDLKGLMAEIIGLDSGVSHGIGGSQHIHNQFFISNGVQGGMVSNAVGLALSFKMKKKSEVVICFIGDGTFGEGIVYESFNLASLLQVPIIFVIENNKYAQSTPIELNLAGSIKKRIEAMDIETFEMDTFNVFDIESEARLIIKDTRTKIRPFGLILNSYRLSPHSKGDDDREQKELNRMKKFDPLLIASKKLGIDNYNILLEQKFDILDNIVSKLYSNESL